MDIDELPFDFDYLREKMVADQLVARGIKDENVLAAMRSVPREYFVNPVDWDEAYEDHPLNIACQQTISQPYIVAYMTEMLALQAGMRVLEIGTGSGYQTAVLSAMGVHVFSLERHENLSQGARDALKKVKLHNRVILKVCDGSIGWKEKAPFDRIIMTCCAPSLKHCLLAQLEDGGIMVAPVQLGGEQVLQKVSKAGGKVLLENMLPVSFVPLIGENGFAEH